MIPCLVDAYESSPEGVTRPGRPRKAVAAKLARAMRPKATAKSGRGAKRKDAAAARRAKDSKQQRKR